MSGRATLTTVPSRKAIPEPATAVASSQRPPGLSKARLAGSRGGGGGVLTAPMGKHQAANCKRLARSVESRRQRRGGEEVGGPADQQRRSDRQQAPEAAGRGVAETDAAVGGAAG